MTAYRLADFNALEDAADELLAREAETVVAEGGATVTMAELLADLFAQDVAGSGSSTSGEGRCS
ncbi:hypothetical protein STRTUCAR8_04752 [Streptomyces turgidiscabies Car8]|uniref:Uncharacterized protein n=1 Tax=Streptomyces turgidiscabies (strain Car8) TaxID=698760 RepID=L7ES56_STRT8|nr:hypothetical protein STRTUCAR8_04752 [Streptomyces turgidiscabies Car8]